jgi:RNA polymerase sigma-70 factor (ECF subfamily)
MARIDLQDYYFWYPPGSCLDVPDEIVDVLNVERRRENAYLRRLFRNKAYYSLDADDGIETSATSHALLPDELYEFKQSIIRLYAALTQLPDKQAKRVYAHYILGMNKAEIAKAEGVTIEAVKDALKRGLSNLKKSLEL